MPLLGCNSASITPPYSKHHIIAVAFLLIISWLQRITEITEFEDKIAVGDFFRILKDEKVVEFSKRHTSGDLIHSQINFGTNIHNDHAKNYAYA